jgi:aminomethyltransferase
MNFFSFNEFDRNGAHYYISRTGYTNRWGWEIYLPVKNAAEDFKAIVTTALDLGGLLVGLGGRDENRISAGAYGLPLMGRNTILTTTRSMLRCFEAAVDMNKDYFVGKAALQKEIDAGCNKKMCIIITEGIVTGRAVYINGKRLGSVTSSINSPNLTIEKRLAIGSKRKNVNEPAGTAAIGLAWLYNNPFELDAEGKDVIGTEDEPVRIHVEFYREDAEGKPIGTAVIGYITAEGIVRHSANRLKNIENL